jgi:hemerythrin
VPDRIRVVFDPNLETGEPEIDGQHRELFARIDRLMEAAHLHHGQQEVGQTLAYLGDYVVHHFAAEERLMVLQGYPDLETHRDEHARFVQQFGQTYQEYKANGPSSLFVIRVGNRITSWLCEHIYRTDRQLVGWLQRKREGT